MRRRRLLQTAAAVAAAPLMRSAIAAPARTLSFVPQANLNSIDPVWTSATTTRNFGLMVFETLFGRDENMNPKPQMLEGHEDTLTAVAFQGRGYLLASSAMDGRVILWQPGNKKAPKIGEHRFEAEASTIAWSPDDRSLTAGAGDGTVALFRAG